MSELYPNQSYGQNIYKHTKLPIFVTQEFDFYRCIAFNENFYGKTVSELHRGNLRMKSKSNRYSSLFSNEKVSYWADSVETARQELKFHCGTNNIITFWAYDDCTSTFPTTTNLEPLFIVDGREFDFDEILIKEESGIPLTPIDKKFISEIYDEKPDCLAYNSKRHLGGINYMFFEKGYDKLALRQVRLRLGNRKAKNKNVICCADTCDYSPYLKGYGYYFVPIAKTKFDSDYLQSEEYGKREKALNISYKRYSEAVNDKI